MISRTQKWIKCYFDKTVHTGFFRGGGAWGRLWPIPDPKGPAEDVIFQKFLIYLGAKAPSQFLKLICSTNYFCIVWNWLYSLIAKLIQNPFFCFFNVLLRWDFFATMFPYFLRRRCSLRLIVDNNWRGYEFTFDLSMKCIVSNIMWQSDFVKFSTVLLILWKVIFQVLICRLPSFCTKQE